ncbi:hypothetical protein ACFLUJ_08740 [Chloroflexota bacterium]
MDIRDLIARFWRIGALFVGGLILIIYIAIGFVYVQQGIQQKDFEDQITKLSPVISKPLPNADELWAKYESINQVLAPITSKDAIDVLVSIAENSGINTGTNTDNTDESISYFNIPSVKLIKKTVGEGNYQLLSFNNISVSGDYSDVMTFISDIDFGETPENIVLKRVYIEHIGLTGIDGGETSIETEAILDIDIYTKP